MQNPIDYYFFIGGIRIRVLSDVSLSFSPNVERFRLAAAPEHSDAVLTHDFGGNRRPPRSDDMKKSFDEPPWMVYRNNGNVRYELFAENTVFTSRRFGLVAEFQNRYRSGLISHVPVAESAGGASGPLLTESISFFSTDQLYLAPLLAGFGGIFLHSAGIVHQGNGYLFVGVSGAGKTTVCRLTADRSKILCDDRIIVREENGAFFIYGTWSHGELHEVNPDRAPLCGIYFLRQAKEQLIPVQPKAAFRELFNHLIHFFETVPERAVQAQIICGMANTVPCYELCFEKESDVLGLIL